MSRPAADSDRRRRAYRKGIVSEAVAAALLTCKGYRILACRFRSPVGEIDLVARRGGTVAFVEVKARRNLDLARESVTVHQQQRIIRAALAWIARNPRHADCDLRFDVITVPPSLVARHLVAAFSADRATLP